jgi:hypothetical protein
LLKLLLLLPLKLQLWLKLLLHQLPKPLQLTRPQFTELLDLSLLRPLPLLQLLMLLPLFQPSLRVTLVALLAF